jgi:hypothetical protein
MKLSSGIRGRRSAKKNTGRRRYTMRDMAIVKHDASVRQAQINRGEITEIKAVEYIAVCGCGAEGCFIHGSYNPIK